MCVHVCMCIYACIHIYIYIHTHIHDLIISYQRRRRRPSSPTRSTRWPRPRNTQAHNKHVETIQSSSSQQTTDINTTSFRNKQRKNGQGQEGPREDRGRAGRRHRVPGEHEEGLLKLCKKHGQITCPAPADHR